MTLAPPAEGGGKPAPVSDFPAADAAAGVGPL